MWSYLPAYSYSTDSKNSKIKFKNARYYTTSCDSLRKKKELSFSFPVSQKVTVAGGDS